MRSRLPILPLFPSNLSLGHTFFPFLEQVPFFVVQPPFLTWMTSLTTYTYTPSPYTPSHLRPCHATTLFASQSRHGSLVYRIFLLILKSPCTPFPVSRAMAPLFIVTCHTARRVRSQGEPCHLYRRQRAIQVLCYCFLVKGGLKWVDVLARSFLGRNTSFQAFFEEKQ